MHGFVGRAPHGADPRNSLDKAERDLHNGPVGRGAGERRRPHDDPRGQRGVSAVFGNSLEIIPVGEGQDQSNQQKAQEQQGIQIRDPGIHSEYANFFTIMGGEDAILLSFANLFGGQNVVQIESKVVLSPRNAKRLALSLGGVIRKYEEQHGEIDIGTPPPQPGTPPTPQGN